MWIFNSYRIFFYHYTYVSETYALEWWSGIYLVGLNYFPARMSTWIQHAATEISFANELPEDAHLKYKFTFVVQLGAQKHAS